MSSYRVNASQVSYSLGAEVPGGDERIRSAVRGETVDDIPAEQAERLAAQAVSVRTPGLVDGRVVNVTTFAITPADDGDPAAPQVPPLEPDVVAVAPPSDVRTTRRRV